WTRYALAESGSRAIAPPGVESQILGPLPSTRSERVAVPIAMRSTGCSVSCWEQPAHRAMRSTSASGVRRHLLTLLVAGSRAAGPARPVSIEPRGRAHWHARNFRDAAFADTSDVNFSLPRSMTLSGTR